VDCFQGGDSDEGGLGRHDDDTAWPQGEVQVRREGDFIVDFADLAVSRTRCRRSLR
jgi:hypothetical protein